MIGELSVVIPAYNASTTVGAAVDSALMAGADEVVVVDDGSSDGTAKVARDLGVLVITQVNLGAAKARQRGLAGVAGRYVVFLDADDELVPEGVKESVRVLDASDGLVAAGGETVGIWPDGSERAWPAKYERVDADAILRSGFGPWPPGGAVIRRTALTDLPANLPRPLGTRYAEDYELFVRLALCGPMARHAVASMKYRLYVGKSSREPLSVLESKERIRYYYSSWLGMDMRRLSDRALRCESHLLRARYDQAYGRRLGAGRSLVRAAAAHPVRFVECATDFVRRRGLGGL